ncbi:MAG: TerC family protein [Planctomycetota bacterium]
MEWLVALFALTAMEIVLGIDNIVFITIVSGKLPKPQQPLARRIGLAVALVTRLLLLFALFFFVRNEQFQSPLFQLSEVGVPVAVIDGMSAKVDTSHLHLDEEIIEQINREHFAAANNVSVKDIILFFGGLFLVWKSIKEIHSEFSHKHSDVAGPSSKVFFWVIFQIMCMDVVFSLDSVITAVGLVEEVSVMVTSIIVAVVIMLIFAEPVSRFVENHPTLKMLALSFMILIGVMLVAEGVGAHIDKGYVYFAMFFGLMVEVLNISIRKKQHDETDDA